MPEKKKKVLFIAGARPNFMKIAPILKCMKRYRRFRPYLVHTGQHYDKAMSKEIFSDLGLPRPNINLGVGSGSHAEQTGQILVEVEKILLTRKPCLVLVVGDVNSTLSGALAAVKLHVPIAHVEAGLRSGDRSMPEEINRLVTDSISDFLFTHSREADRNLVEEGASKNRIYFVGNVMIDTLFQMKERALKYPPISKHSYGLITLHRPSNVDHPKVLKGIFSAFESISKELPLFFPVHPRSAEQLRKNNLLPKSKNFRLMRPLSYLPFLSGLMGAELVLTDSGGIQEETTALRIPCLTLRRNTERGVTVTHGTNQVVGDRREDIVTAAKILLRRGNTAKKQPPLWDGKASERIVRIIHREI